MISTRVGYAGGKQDRPTYRSMGDQTEALQIEFDPKLISFTDLLAIFWEEHDPYGAAWSTQYKAVLWTHGPEQARIAKESITALTKKRGKKPTTECAVAGKFWIGEDYHQKYYLRSRTALLRALTGEKATDDQVRESTVCARANGWIAGYGTVEEIASGSKALGLDEKATEELARALGRRAPVQCR